MVGTGTPLAWQVNLWSEPLFVTADVGGTDICGDSIINNNFIEVMLSYPCLYFSGSENTIVNWQFSHSWFDLKIIFVLTLCIWVISLVEGKLVPVLCKGILNAIS